jgi:hypothetical protein
MKLAVYQRLSGSLKEGIWPYIQSGCQVFNLGQSDIWSLVRRYPEPGCIGVLVAPFVHPLEPGVGRRQFQERRIRDVKDQQPELRGPDGLITEVYVR